MHSIQMAASGQPAPGGSSNYSETAVTAESSKAITHNFGVYPSVLFINGSGVEEIPSSITHNSKNQVTVAFGSNVTGTIRLMAS